MLRFHGRPRCRIARENAILTGFAIDASDGRLGVRRRLIVASAGKRGSLQAFLRPQRAGKVRKMRDSRRSKSRLRRADPYFEW